MTSSGNSVQTHCTLYDYNKLSDIFPYFWSHLSPDFHTRPSKLKLESPNYLTTGFEIDFLAYIPIQG